MKKEKTVFGVLLLSGILLYLFTDVSFSLLLTESLLVYACAAFVVSKTAGKCMEVSFEGVHQCGKGIPQELKMHVKNISRIPVLHARIYLTVENKLTGENTNLEQDVSLFSKKEKCISFVLESGVCGCIEAAVKNIEYADPLRLCVKKRMVHAETVCYVFPVMQEIPFSEEQWSRYDMESYQYSAIQRGDDPSETFGIREYQEGDSLKSIHWKLSGKTGDLVVRELGLPVENSLMILLDKSCKRDETLSAESIDRMTELFLSLSHTAAEHGIRHTIGWYNYVRETFEVYPIRQEDDIYLAVSEMLRSPHCEDTLTTAERFLISGKEKNYAMYIYVTESDMAEKETERLADYGNVEIYRTKDFK